MADAKTTLEIIIAATDATASGFSSVGGKISELSNAAGDITAPFASLAKGVLAVDAALVALTGGGLAMAVQASGEFSGQFAEISTITAANADQLAAFRSDILAYANTSTKSIDDINLAIYEAISTGVKYEDSLDVIRTAEQLAVGGKAELADSLKVLVSSLNAYGESTDKAGEYADALFVAVKVGATTMPELAQSLSMVTNIAATAGVSFDELLSAIAALTATGMPTSQAVESIRSVLANVIKPSQMAQEEAGKLGLQFDAAALKTKGLAGFLADLNAKTGGSIESTSKLIGDVTGLNAAMTLTGNGASIFATALDEMTKKAGAAAAAYQVMVTQFGNINEQLANNVKTVLIAVGDKIKDEYAVLVGSLVDILQALGTAVNSGAFDGLFTVIEEAMNEASTALQGIAKALPEALKDIDFSGLSKSLGGVGDSIKGLFGGLDLTKPEDLQKVIQQVVDSLESLTRFTAGMIDSLRPFFAAIQQGIDKFNALDAESKNSAGGLTGFMTALNFLTGPIDAVGKGIAGLGTGLEALAGASLAKTIAGLVGPGGLSTAATTAGAALAKAGLYGAAAAGGYAVGTGINAVIDDITTLLTGGKADSFGAWLYDITHASEEAGAAVDLAGKRIKVLAQPVGEAGTAAETAAVAFSENTQKLLDNAAAAGRTEEMQRILAGQAQELGMVYNTTTGAFEKANAATEVSLESFRDLKTGVIDLSAYYAALGRTGSGPIATTTKALDDVAKQSKETEKQLLELASEERIKSMEFSASIKIANIEADKEALLAAFDSINAAIDSTGKTWTALWGQINDVSGLDKLDLKDAIEAEEKRRDQAFEQQEKINQQIIELNAAKLELYKNGKNETEIKITGGNPLIEYVVIELFKQAQVYVASDGGAVLLGAPSV